MTLKEVMSELAAKGTAQTKKTYLRHGAKEPFFGVLISDLKVIHKKIKGDQALAMELYATGNGDAQYLAGMVADGKKMTSAQLQKWVTTASWSLKAMWPGPPKTRLAPPARRLTAAPALLRPPSRPWT